MAANRLFYKDAYQRQCTTDVVSVTEGKDGVAVALKESLFHAQGGGQPADRGEKPFSQAHSRCSSAFLRLPG